ncbi:MAG TPA: hypothetical protein DIT43_02755 [Dehalococcoidia bacterium]|nr:hypothetical protein [Dehalococcoidia bacterium]
MSGKAQRHRRKHSSKSRSIKQASPVIASERQPVAQSPEPAFQPRTPVSLTKVPVSPAQYPYVATELRAIGILAGAMLVVLVVLALVLA